MLTIQIANSSIGNVAWEPSLTTQALLLNLSEEHRSAFIEILEDTMSLFFLNLSAMAVVGPHSLIAADDLKTKLRSHAAFMQAQLTVRGEEVAPEA